MPIPLPRGRFKRWLTTPQAYDLAGGLIAPVTGAATAFRFFATGDNGWGFAVAAATVLYLVLNVGKARAAYRLLQKKEDLHELAGCLHTFNAILLAGANEAENGLRSTIHVPVGNDQLMQVLDYIGDQRSKKTAGRAFSAYCGVIGRVYRSRNLFVGSRQTLDNADFVKSLIEEYGYTEEQAKELDPYTLSWMAVPITDRSGAIEGILYIDSTDRDFFTPERQLAAVWAAVGIAFFVGRRYSSV